METETTNDVLPVNTEDTTPESLTTNEETAQEGESDESKKDFSEMDPEKRFKSLTRAVSRLKQTREKINAKNAELQNKVLELEKRLNSTGVQAVNPDGSPNEAAYEGRAGEYLVELAKYELRKENESKNEESKKAEQEQLRNKYIEQKTGEIAKYVEEHKKELTDMPIVIEDNIDIIDDFPPFLENAFYECEDAALAFYNLAKEGKLESLLTMGPYQAIAEIHRAATFKPTIHEPSRAPKPIMAAKGNAVSKDEDAMSGNELLRKYKLKT